MNSRTPINLFNKIDSSLKPIQDQENGYYRFAVKSNDKARKGLKWRRFVILCCTYCNELYTKRMDIFRNIASKYDHTIYCSHKCYFESNVVTEYVHNGKLYTLKDVPKSKRCNTLHPIKTWLNNNEHNRLYMIAYNEENQDK